jgi:hypothetical protein
MRFVQDDTVSKQTDVTNRLCGWVGVVLSHPYRDKAALWMGHLRSL